MIETYRSIDKGDPSYATENTLIVTVSNVMLSTSTWTQVFSSGPCSQTPLSHALYLM